MVNIPAFHSVEKAMLPSRRWVISGKNVKIKSRKHLWWYQYVSEAVFTAFPMGQAFTAYYHGPGFQPCFQYERFTTQEIVTFKQANWDTSLCVFWMVCDFAIIIHEIGAVGVAQWKHQCLSPLRSRVRFLVSPGTKVYSCDREGDSVRQRRFPPGSLVSSYFTLQLPNSVYRANYVLVQLNIYLFIIIGR